MTVGSHNSKKRRASDTRPTCGVSEPRTATWLYQSQEGLYNMYGPAVVPVHNSGVSVQRAGQGLGCDSGQIRASRRNRAGKQARVILACKGKIALLCPGAYALPHCLSCTGVGYCYITTSRASPLPSMLLSCTGPVYTKLLGAGEVVSVAMSTLQSQGVTAARIDIPVLALI